jgi:hypothetical protein
MPDWKSLLEEQSGAIAKGDFSGVIDQHNALLEDYSEPDDMLEDDLSDWYDDFTSYSDCDAYTELWAESLQLAYAHETGELTEAGLARLQDIAAFCAISEGPGVFVARSQLALAYSDARNCYPPESQQLRLDMEDSTTAIFPNPVGKDNVVDFSQTVSGSFELISLDGRVLENWNQSEVNSLRLPADLGSGVYILRFTSESNMTTNWKIVKQ